MPIYQLGIEMKEGSHLIGQIRKKIVELLEEDLRKNVSNINDKYLEQVMHKNMRMVLYDP